MFNEFLQQYVNKLDLMKLLTTSYLNQYSDTFSVISFGNATDTDKMIKAIIKSQPDDIKVELTKPDGTRIRLELVHQEAGRAYIDKQTKKPTTAEKSANGIFINVLPPNTVAGISTALNL